MSEKESLHPSDAFTGPSLAADTEAPKTSDVAGHALFERIGIGGMGEVYRCGNDALQRHLALKVLRPEQRGNADAEERFLREARLTALAWLRSNGVRTTGRVVRLERDRYPTTGQQPPYAAVAEFEANGRRYEAKGASAFPPLYREGEPVPVYYPPDRPDRGRIVTGREFAVAWCFLALGVVFWSVAVAIASLR